MRLLVNYLLLQPEDGRLVEGTTPLTVDYTSDNRIKQLLAEELEVPEENLTIKGWKSR